ncbi:MAG TPA: CAP domain-containing protein [Anaerolineales bacterium]|jgi:uncharacterized protein YkwD|nr:CAP domain-containing protein [Anaerolineales bacterium]
MVKKLFIVTAWFALALSACSGGGATELPASTASELPAATTPASVTEPPIATETAETPVTDTVSVTDMPATPLTATPTVGTPIPTNPPDCTNSALFVTDVTIPDNTNMVGGTTFTKTWRISNNGTCVWGPTYTLTHYSDERLGAPDSVPLGLTYPGSTLDISVDLVAPNTTGTHRGNFVIKNPEGLIMKVADDSRLWVIINVTSTSAPTVAISATPFGFTSTPAGSVTPTATGPTPAQGSSSSNFTTASCAFTTDRTKLTEVITALNNYRAQKGLPAYTVNSKLAEAAQRHANDIACHKIYVHTGTDGSTARSRVTDTGYVAKSVSENVNGNYPPLSGQEAINWWINDKGDVRHGQNLISTTFTEIGVGYAFFDDYGFYAVVFAQP